MIQSGVQIQARLWIQGPTHSLLVLYMQTRVHGSELTSQMSWFAKDMKKLRSQIQRSQYQAWHWWPLVQSWMRRSC